jgi:uncharacterized protein YggE
MPDIIPSAWILKFFCGEYFQKRNNISVIARRASARRSNLLNVGRKPNFSGILRGLPRRRYATPRNDTKNNFLHLHLKFAMKTASRLTLALLLGILSLPIALFAQRSITVTGSGSVTAKPDHAVVTMMLTSQNNTAQTVFSLNDENASRLMKSLSDAGVAPEDIEQRTFALNPTYDYSSGGGAPPRLVGYHMMATYQVKVRNLKSLPIVLDAGTIAGANNVTIEGYGVSNTEKLENQATKEAINDAREAAGRLAKEMGGALGEILSVSDAESSGSGGSGMMGREEEERRGPGAINPKEIRKKVELKVTFSVK